jgi:formamidopyrimidine-DNA glycosylase
MEGGVPELPEIEVLRETLARELGGRPVAAVRARQIALVKTYDPPLECIEGEQLEGARRHGKHLLLDFGDDHTLAIHLSIGGRIVFADAGRKSAKFVSLEIGFEDGGMLHVVELGTKKRSSVHVLRRGAVAAHLAPLGIDALSPEVTPALLAELLQADRVQLKRFLTDQHRLAGIGNAYSDEILWEARLAPLRLTTSLGDDDVEQLCASIGVVLARAIETAREDNYLTLARGDKRGTFRVHRREKEPCPRCGEPIAGIHFAESSLQYCPACQEGRRYADRRLSRLLK